LANTLASITWSVMLAMGAVIGGIVGALFGASVALVIDAITFGVAALLIARIRLPKNIPDITATADATEQPGSGQGFVDGLRYLAKRPGTAAILLIKAGGSIGNIDTLITIYATAIFINQIDSELSLG